MRRVIAVALGAATVCIFVGVQPASAGSGTDMSGLISQDTTWTPAGSPYTLTSSVEIVEGVTLTIQPGVLVQGQPFTTLRVRRHATLTAIGTLANPIEFTSVLWQSPDWDDQWMGIDVQGDSNLDNSPHVTIQHAIIGDSQSYGLQTGSPFTSVQDVQFQYNVVGYYYSTPINAPLLTIQSNRFLRNEWGLQVLDGFLNSPINVQQNDFWNNRTAISLFGGTGMEIHGNDILRSRGYAFWDGDLIIEPCGGANCAVYGVDVTDNWWGTTNTSQIEARILDGNDKSGRGTALFNPPSGGPNTPWPPSPDTHSRAVSLTLRGHLSAIGSVNATDGFERCESRVLVKIEKKTSNGWAKIKQVRTDSQGNFATSIPDGDGSYRASVTELSFGDPPTDACLPGKSSVRKHND